MSQIAAPASKNQAKEAKPCVSCGSTEPWGFSSWCPQCGYYPALQTRVEAPAVPVRDDSRPASLKDILPPWVLLMGGGMFVVIGVSVWARLAVDGESSARLLWAVSQILVGLIAFGVAHGTAYFVAITHSDKIGPFDAIMSPMVIWRPTFARLPKGASRTCLAVWGITAVLTALLIVDGIPWASLFDGKATKKKAAPNLLQKVVKEARKERASEEESLEGAIESFVGDAEEGAAKEDEKDAEMTPEEKEKAEKAKAEKERAERLAKKESLDCVIFGYQPESDDDFGVLMLATIVKGRLSFVCTVTAESVPPEERKRMMEKFKTLHRTRPLVKTTLDGTWVQPVLMCRVAHSGWTRDKRLKNAEFVESLADVTSSR